MIGDRRAWLALAAFVAVAAAFAAGWAWPRRAPAHRVVAGGEAPPADGPNGAPPVNAGTRDEALDQVEAAEAATYGEEEAARRRRKREQMLDLRAEEH